MIKAVFFDVGATLIHPSPPVAEMMARVAAVRGHALGVHDFEQYMPAMDAYYEAEYLRDGDFWCSRKGSVAIWLDQYRYVCHLAGIAHDAEGMANSLHEAYRRAESWEAYSDVVGCLRVLKQLGLLLGVVSNWDAELESLLRGMNLLPYFDTVVSSADVGYRKPNPVIFELACERLGVTPEQSLHVGDRPDADGDGAYSAGIRPLIIDRSDVENGCAYECVKTLAGVVSLVRESYCSSVV